MWSSTRTARSPQWRNPAMAVANASLGSFFDALVEPSSRTLRRQRRGHVDDVLTGLEELLGQQLAQPPSGLDRPGPLVPSGSAQANSRWIWHRSATSCNRASGRSSRSIATAVWVDLCGSTPMITVMESPPRERVERHDGHS